jgi:hypothetical protein
VPNSDVEWVRADIADLLVEQGWQADRHRVLAGSPEVVADFWIPLGERGGGCAVLLSDSVLAYEQGRRLADQATAIRLADPDRAVVLVICGYLAVEQRPMLTDALAEGVLIVYNVRTFGKDFALAVGAARDRVVGGMPGARADGSADDEVRLLREEISRVVRQQASTLRAMQELAVRTEDGLGALQRAVTAIPARYAGTDDSSQELPDELKALFGQARRSLDGYGDVPRFVAETIQAAVRRSGERFSRTHQLREHDAFTRIGISTFLSDLLDGFRDSVQSWFGSLRLGPARGVVTDDERVLLREICQTYDALYNVAPVYRLDSLPGMTSQPGDDQASALPSRSARRDALTAAFAGLGDRVFRAALTAASGQGGR